MIQELLQIIVVGIIAVLFATILKKHWGELSLLLGLGTGVIIGIFILKLFRPILDFIEELVSLSHLDPNLLEPVLKCLGIGLLTQICVNICSDSGQSAIGKMIEIAGSVLCLYISLPLFRSVISLLGNIGGEP